MIEIVLASPLVVVAWLVVGSFRRHRTTWRQDAKRRSDHVRGLPAGVLLLQVVSGAGAPPRSAIEVVGGLDVGDGPLGVVIADLATVARWLELGAGMTTAILSVESTRASAPLVRVLDVLRRAEVDGVPLEPHLAVLVRELRRERAQALDLAAQRLTVSLLFPLVLCILPAFVLLAIAPLLLDALSNLPV